jgi:hypothetical protein
MLLDSRGVASRILYRHGVTNGRLLPNVDHESAETGSDCCHQALFDIGDFLGKTPKIFPVASIKRKVSGSWPGWRRATSCARSLAAAIASAALGKTEVSVSTTMPRLSQTINAG